MAGERGKEVIHTFDDRTPNLDICGLMVTSQPECPCPCDNCEGILVEAWERMTNGGVNGATAIEYWRWAMTTGRGIIYSSWFVGLV